jgi:pyruvate kinase
VNARLHPVGVTTLTSTEEIELQRRQGLAFAVDLGQQGASYLSRIYVDDAELYQLVYVADDVSLDDAEVTAFFDSFQFSEGG